MTEGPRALQKALTRALNSMYTPLGASSQRVEWTEEQVRRMDYGRLKGEQQRALAIVYGPRADFPPGEVPQAIVEVVEGAKEVISIINKILEATS